MKYFAKTYGDENLQKRIDGIMQSQNLSEQSAKAEIVANSCMTVFDENFITNFTKTHIKEARTIKDWFNRLVARIRQAMDKVKKYVTEYRAISDDVAEVERIRDLFNAALSEKNSTGNKKSVQTKYSIKTIVDENGKNYGKGVYLDSNIFDGLNESARKDKIVEYINTLAGQGFYATNKNGEPVLIEIPTSKKFKNKSGKKKKANNDLIRKNNNSVVKLQSLSLIDETIQLSKYDSSSPSKYSHGWLDDDGKSNWDYYTVFLQEKNKTVWSATLNVATNANGNKILYDISPIKKVEPGVKSPATTINSITKKRDNVNSRNKNLQTESNVNDDKIDLYKADIQQAKLYTYDGIEWFEKSKEFYQKYQSGTANKNNFYIDTIADFESVKSRPKRSPDYVSYYFDKNGSYRVSSEYWYYDNYVVRGSNHWGVDIASCDWLLDGKSQKGVKRYGKADWSDFVCKTEIKKYKNTEFLTSFENTYGKGQQDFPIYKVKGEYVSYDRLQHKLIKQPNSYVKNTDEFNSNDTELVYSTKQFKNALTSGEWKKYNNAMATGIDAGIRISDNSILVECENNSQWQYKYVIYDNYSDRNEISDVFAIGKIDNNVEDDVAFQCNEIAVYINDVKELGYDNKSYFKKILRTRLKDTSYILAQYNNKSKRYNVIGRGSIENGTNTVDKPNGRGILTADSRNLKFSVKQPIEETKDLIAIHNTTEKKLLSALELGGLPSPSIAIMKAENTRGNNDFGNISLVFDKSTVDPQADTANKVYSSDAYTPIAVRAEHKLNENKAWDVYSKIRELSKQKLAYNLNPTSFHPDNLKSSIDSAGGINELIDSYKNDYEFKELYLADTAEPVKNALTSSEWKKYNNAMATGIDAGTRISDTAMLIEREKGEFNYKLVFYDNTYEDYPITAVYGIGEAGFREDITNFDAKYISDIINTAEVQNYANKKIIKGILRDISKGYGIVLRRYSDGNTKSFTIRPKNNASSQNNNEKSNGAGVPKTDSQNLKFSVKQPVEETKDLVLHTECFTRSF